MSKHFPKFVATSLSLLAGGLVIAVATFICSCNFQSPVAGPVAEKAEDPDDLTEEEWQLFKAVNEVYSERKDIASGHLMAWGTPWQMRDASDTRTRVTDLKCPIAFSEQNKAHYAQVWQSMTSKLDRMYAAERAEKEAAIQKFSQ